jgi:hypothetical protein
MCFSRQSGASARSEICRESERQGENLGRPSRSDSPSRGKSSSFDRRRLADLFFGPFSLRKGTKGDAVPHPLFKPTQWHVLVPLLAVIG